MATNLQPLVDALANLITSVKSLFSNPAFTALLGGVSGALVTEGAAFFRNQRREKQQNESLRLMLKLEINHNLSEIRVIAEGLDQWVHAQEQEATKYT